MPTIGHPVITKKKPTTRGTEPCPVVEAAMPLTRANNERKKTTTTLA